MCERIGAPRVAGRPWAVKAGETSRSASTTGGVGGGRRRCTAERKMAAGTRPALVGTKRRGEMSLSFGRERRTN